MHLENEEFISLSEAAAICGLSRQHLSLLARRGKLEAKKIKPAPEADRYTLIRRVYYDLLGLPPTPLEADAFVKDSAPCKSS